MDVTNKLTLKQVEELCDKPLTPLFRVVENGEVIATGGWHTLAKQLLDVMRENERLKAEANICGNGPQCLYVISENETLKKKNEQLLNALQAYDDVMNAIGPQEHDIAYDKFFSLRKAALKSNNVGNMYENIITEFKKLASNRGFFLKSLHGLEYNNGSILWIPEFSKSEHKEIKIEVKPYMESDFKYEPATTYNYAT